MTFQALEPHSTISHELNRKKEKKKKRVFSFRLDKTVWQAKKTPNSVIDP